MRIAVACLLVATVSLSACSSLSSMQAVDGVNSDGLVYHLPRRDSVVTVTKAVADALSGSLTLEIVNEKVDACLEAVRTSNDAAFADPKCGEQAQRTAARCLVVPATWIQATAGACHRLGLRWVRAVHLAPPFDTAGLFGSEDDAEQRR